MVVTYPAPVRKKRWCIASHDEELFIHGAHGNLLGTLLLFIRERTDRPCPRSARPRVPVATDNAILGLDDQCRQLV